VSLYVSRAFGASDPFHFTSDIWSRVKEEAYVKDHRASFTDI
jgi:hypothetical protein